MFSINDFMQYASTGEVSTVYSRQQTAKAKAPVARSVKPAIAPVTSVRQVASIAPVQPVVVPAKPLELVHYSERSFAIFGDTKPIQAQLEGLGGKFNRWLKRNGAPTPGFIFSITRIDAVRKALDL